jgi:hypothetical protein
MAQVLAQLTRTTWINDIICLGAGAFDGWLLDKSPLAFMVKNIGIPIASLFVRVPDALKYESESMLGLMIYAIIFGKR